MKNLTPKGIFNTNTKNEALNMLRTKFLSALLLIVGVLFVGNVTSATADEKADTDIEQIISIDDLEVTSTDVDHRVDQQSDVGITPILLESSGDIDHQVINKVIIDHSKVTNSDGYIAYLARSNLCSKATTV